MRHSNPSNVYGNQLSIRWVDSEPNTYVRVVNNNSFGAWRTILADFNYNSYAPTLTGTGASGTWAINVTGTAGSETLATVTGRGATTTTAITTGVLTVNTGGTGTWGPFVVTSTSQWGDGATQYVTIGAGGAAGIMINNPHIVWNTSETAAGMKFGRSGGISSGAYYVIGTGASDNFFITKNGAIGSPQLNINTSGNATFSGTLSASNLSGTNTGDQTNISGNAATATTAGTVTHNASRADVAYYNVGWFAGNPSPAYSCDAVQIQSSTGTLKATILSASSTDGIVNQENGSSAGWRGRILSKNSIADKASFLGTYGTIAGVFSHNNALNAWADLYVNTVDATSGGNVRLPATTYINGYAAVYASGTWAISISGNATTATTATTATGNVLLRSQSNWNDTTVISNVVGLLAWKNYGNNHVIFDASASTSPSGGAVNSTNAAIPWTATYPTLMGWNGSGTYGVRVDSARVADSATDSTKLPLTGGNLSGTLSFSQPVGLSFANGQYVKDNGGGGFIIYGGALIQLNSDVQTSAYMLVGGNYTNNAYVSVASTRLMFGGGNADAVENYYIGTNMNNYGGNYTKLEFRWHTGIRMGAQPGYGGIRMYDTEDLATVIFSVGETDSNTRGYYDIIAYASDKRLKHNIQPIENALSKVKSLTGMTYQWNEVGRQHGWKPDMKIREAGVFAQDVQAVLPEAVRPAPFDHELGKSKSGENYLTVKYDKIVPLLIEAIKELTQRIEDLERDR
jgi:hypothetical protein